MSKKRPRSRVSLEFGHGSSTILPPPVLPRIEVDEELQMPCSMFFNSMQHFLTLLPCTEGVNMIYQALKGIDVDSEIRKSMNTSKANEARLTSLESELSIAREEAQSLRNRLEVYEQLETPAEETSPDSTSRYLQPTFRSLVILANPSSTPASQSLAWMSLQGLARTLIPSCLERFTGSTQPLRAKRKPIEIAVKEVAGRLEEALSADAKSPTEPRQSHLIPFPRLLGAPCENEDSLVSALSSDFFRSASQVVVEPAIATAIVQMTMLSMTSHFATSTRWPGDRLYTLQPLEVRCDDPIGSHSWRPSSSVSDTLPSPVLNLSEGDESMWVPIRLLDRGHESWLLSAVFPSAHESCPAQYAVYGLPEDKRSNDSIHQCLAHLGKQLNRDVSVDVCLVNMPPIPAESSFLVCWEMLRLVQQHMSKFAGYPHWNWFTLHEEWLGHLSDNSQGLANIRSNIIACVLKEFQQCSDLWEQARRGLIIPLHPHDPAQFASLG